MASTGIEAELAEEEALSFCMGGGDEQATTMAALAGGPKRLPLTMLGAVALLPATRRAVLLGDAAAGPESAISSVPKPQPQAAWGAATDGGLREPPPPPPFVETKPWPNSRSELGDLLKSLPHKFVLCVCLRVLTPPSRCVVIDRPMAPHPIEGALPAAGSND